MADKNRAANSTSTAADDSATLKDRAKHWGIVGVIALIGVFIATYLLPLQWKNLITGIVDGSFTAGILLGVAIGAAFTFLPIWLIMKGWRMRSQGSSSFLLFLGLGLLIPNLLTAWTYMRATDSTKSFAQEMASEAPGFGFGTALGAVIAVGFGLYLMNVHRQRDKAKKEAAEERERREAAEKINDTTHVVDHSSSSSPASSTIDVTDAPTTTTTGNEPTTPPHP